MIRPLFLVALCVLAGHAGAQGNVYVSRGFQHAVRLQLPEHLMPTFEQATDQEYLIELAPFGQSAIQWDKRLTLHGIKTLGQKITAREFAMGWARGYHTACPATYSALNIGALNVNGLAGHAVVVSCGMSAAAAKQRSETTVNVVVQAGEDLYEILWAERAAASATPLLLDQSLLAKTLHWLAATRFCPLTKSSLPMGACRDKVEAIKTRL
ncbi:hypothetical protein [Noviherbaspirillum galbum]|uniref:Uncharacterized protein n=1 Tax=Noviherbaspirillum galbum TaxID=2709383 RepID=A0A6B3SXC7_9BURK|nr:hypothetical protein [Noviherbaspirillum galbum]NEX64195.1 hypothetical protein [Noviherbaspirillum galbum]